MAFTLPNFNLLADVWVVGSDPTTQVPDFIDVPVQLYFKQNFNDNNDTRYYIRMATLAVTSVFVGTNFKIKNAGVANGVFFESSSSAWVHLGFPNEYWSVQCYTVVWAGGASQVWIQLP